MSVPADQDRVRCPGCAAVVTVADPPATVQQVDDGTGTGHVVIYDRGRQILHECANRTERA